MFTGIVEEIGVVRNISRGANGATLTVECSTILEDIKIGDSVSINGVCETVVSFDSKSFVVQISDETLSVTNFSKIKNGDFVNLERALMLNSRLGGHIVSGHIDTQAQIVSIEKLADFYNISLRLPDEILKYVVYKGSIAVNGISLTVADIENNICKIAIIPHTFNNTNFKYLNIGDFVNIETDILARYVEKMLSANDNNSSKIDMSFLQENGFV